MSMAFLVTDEKSLCILTNSLAVSTLIRGAGLSSFSCNELAHLWPLCARVYRLASGLQGVTIPRA